MKIVITDNPAEIGYNAIKDEAFILREDVIHGKEVTRKIKTATNKKTIQKQEREFYDLMVEHYGTNVAGELLANMWISSRGKRI